MDGMEGQCALPYFEAEETIAKLKSAMLETIGTKSFFEQHGLLGKLNIQAHLNIQQQRDEYITELLQKENKLDHVIQELVIIKAWKREVYPGVAHLLTQENHTQFYLCFYHEAVLLNLIQVLMMDASSVPSLGDSLIDLIDYCCERLVWLNDQAAAGTVPTDDQRGKGVDLSAKEQLDQQAQDIQLGTAMGAIAILHLLSDQFHDMPVNLIARLIMDHDVIRQMVYLIQAKPWQTRDAETGQWSTFQNGTWQKTHHDDLRLIHATEGQIWVFIYNAFTDADVKRKYTLDHHKQTLLLELRPFMDDVFLDQLPAMTHLKRALEELAITSVPNVTASVPMIKEVTKHADPLSTHLQKHRKAILQAQLHVFQSYTAQDNYDNAKRLAQVYDMDSLESLLGEEPKCAVCGAEAEKRCSNCRNEWYCSRQCQVKAWPKHKAICALMASSNALRQIG